MRLSIRCVPKAEIERLEPLGVLVQQEPKVRRWLVCG